MYHPGSIDAGLVLSAWTLRGLEAFHEEYGEDQGHVQSLPSGEDNFCSRQCNWKHVAAPLTKAPN